MYGVICVQLTHLILGDREDIFVIYFIVINSNVSTFSIVVTISGVVCLSWLYHHILSVVSYLSREIWVLFPIPLCSLWLVRTIGYIMAWRSRPLFAYCGISYLSLWCLIRKQWTNKMLVRYILPGVSKIKHILSCICCAIYGVCVFSSPISLLMVVKIFILHFMIIIKPEIWIISHCF